jgi:hypothetical protein
MVLNTSFNENEPVVCKPEEALDCSLQPLPRSKRLEQTGRHRGVGSKDAIDVRRRVHVTGGGYDRGPENRRGDSCAEIFAGGWVPVGAG